MWRTGLALGGLIVRTWNVDVDVAALPENSVCERFIAPPPMMPDDDGVMQPVILKNVPGRICVARDALTTPWAPHGKSAYCNSPFAKLLQFMKQAVAAKNEGMHVVVLGPDNGDTEWAKLAADEGATFYRFFGRPAFVPHDSTIDDSSGAGFPTALHVFKPYAPRRKVGDPVPTYWLDPTTFRML